MICMKSLRFSSRPKAKVRCQGPPGSARAQPRLCLSTVQNMSHFIYFHLQKRSVKKYKNVNKQTYKWINKTKRKRVQEENPHTSTKETLNSYYQLKKITFRNPMLIIFLRSAKFNFVWLKRLLSSLISLYKEVHMFCLFIMALWKKHWSKKGNQIFA